MKLRVLVVDDDWAMRELYKNMLELSGFDLLLAASAAEFREIALKEKFDAIILDIILGDDNGPQIYEEVLHRGLSSDIPVIFVSGLAKDQPPIYPQQNRKFSLIGKPFDSEKLVRELRKAI
ncbi:MAG: response regulator [Candidatus Omnitrophica bacterium]|nr:response regulator [Candidatus Omnitrophota bacterium]